VVVAFVVAVGDEAQCQRHASEQQRPCVEIGDRAPAGEANARHAVVEVLAVGAVERLPVLQALEHHEGRVEKRHREQDQRQHERHDRLGLDRGLDGDDAHQQAEQLRAAVAHEAGRGWEVVDQEAERRTGGQRCEHAGLLATEVERDDRHRGGDYRAYARRETVDAVGEVDDVHHHHQADHRQHRSRVGGARVGKRQRADERQRDRLHGHAEVHDDHRGDDLAEQLERGVQVEAVVEGADERDHRGGEQHAVPQMRLLFAGVARRQPDQPRDERTREDREPAEKRRGTLREAALAWLVDCADGPREAHREGGQQRGDDRGGQEGEKGVELRWVHHRLA
jgi:hypothetical protein